MRTLSAILSTITGPSARTTSPKMPPLVTTLSPFSSFAIKLIELFLAPAQGHEPDDVEDQEDHHREGERAEQGSETSRLRLREPATRRTWRRVFLDRSRTAHVVGKRSCPKTRFGLNRLDPWFPASTYVVRRLCPGGIRRRGHSVCREAPHREYRRTTSAARSVSDPSSIPSRTSCIKSR